MSRTLRLRYPLRSPLRQLTPPWPTAFGISFPSAVSHLLMSCVLSVHGSVGRLNRLWMSSFPSPTPTSEHAPSTHHFFPHPPLHDYARHYFGLGPRCSFRRSVFGQSPAPCGITQRPSHRTQHLYGSCFIRCTRLSTLHASLLRSWTTVFVPAECLRTAPCPLWDHTGPSRRSQHLFGSELAAAYAFPSARLCLPQLCHWPRPYCGTT
jgi:hypothetical protein